MNLIQLKNVKLKDFGPFDGDHSFNPPQSGMVLIKGLVEETGDGSGAGKSYLLKAISYIFGGCPDPATELQSWYTDSPPEVEIIIETDKGIINIKRKKGLSVSGKMYKEPIKGKAAEAELDKIFGMDKESRAIVTYRGQRQPGLFLSLTDEKKKAFLATLLGLEQYEKGAKSAQERIPDLERQVESKKIEKGIIEGNLTRAKVQLEAQKTELLQVTSGYTPGKEQELRAIIKTGKDKINLLQKQIDTAKIETERELDAVIVHVRAKLSKYCQPTESIEVTGLKKIQKDTEKKLEAVKVNYINIKNNVVQERNVIKTKIESLKAVSVKKSSYQEKMLELQNKKVLLQKQICSECKREWEGPEYQLKLDAVKKNILILEAELQKLGDPEQEIQKLKIEYNNIKDPELDPRIQEFESLIKQHDSQIKTKNDSDNAARRKAVSDLEQEERNIKDTYRTSFINKTTSLNQEKISVASSIESAENDERSVLRVRALCDAKRAVVSEIESQVKRFEVDLVSVSSEQSKYDLRLNLEKDIIALLGRQGFLGTIVEEVLMEIAANANDIMSRVANIRHLSIDFETEKEAVSTGNITARITPVIYSKGRKVSFSSGISGGMQAAVELAVDLAVGDVISRRRGSYPGFLILDETFHGLGGVAKESCLEMLQSYAGDRVVFVVDHSSEFQGLFHEIISIKQVDGRSTILDH